MEVVKKVNINFGSLKLNESKKRTKFQPNFTGGENGNFTGTQEVSMDGSSS